MGWGPKAPDMTASNTAAANQASIALEQWNTAKAYLPKAQALAEREDARSQRMADESETDRAYYRGVSQHQVAEARKAEPFQERARGMASEYDSGAYSEAEAGRASADVEQRFGDSAGALQRSAGRMGLDTGSAGFMASMGDMYTQKSLASAGARTSSRLGSRDRAVAMVTAAAGSGQGSFSNGMSAGSASGGYGNSAGVQGAGGAGLANVAQGTYSSSMGSAGSGMGGASANLRANAIESAKNPGFDAVMGLAAGGMKMAGAMSDRRLKTSIRRVGTLDNGLAVYTFRYKSGGPTVMGVMADEVEKLLPHAVLKRAIDNEYDAVNYGAL